MTRDIKKRSVSTRVRRQKDHIKEFRARILRWFRYNGREFPWREANASTYVQILSELLLQRTKAGVVAGFLPEFLAAYPDWRHLAVASAKDLGRLLIPLGLWRRRSRTLKLLAAAVVDLGGDFPIERRSIEALPGVGQYVASAILLFCHNGREPLLDVNMARVLERCFGSRTLVDIRYDPWLQLLAREITDHRKARDINWAVLDLAAMICTVRTPKCGVCPVRTMCKFANARQ